MSGLPVPAFLIAASMGRSGGNEPRLVTCVTSLTSAVTAAVYCFGHAGLVPQNSSARWHFLDRPKTPTLQCKKSRTFERRVLVAWMRIRRLQERIASNTGARGRGWCRGGGGAPGGGRKIRRGRVAFHKKEAAASPRACLQGYHTH